MLSLLIRALNRRKLRQLEAGGPEAQQARFMELVRQLEASPLALCTQEANDQHYELPPAFFERILGPAMKYSSGLWEPGTVTLAQAEQAMLDLYCDRAQLQDGQDVLELGCGWGSLTLHMARRYPSSRIVAVSNSRPQREFIEARAAREGLTNLRILTQDINLLELSEQSFDRIVSVEMFEHVRNYARLFALLKGALRASGSLFVHIFCHVRHAYPFDQGWMERNFFSGGLMPSLHLLLYFSQGLELQEHWAVDGRHYEKTARAWLANMRASKPELMPILRAHYGRLRSLQWWFYWQLFFLACAELFGTDRGSQWMVTHLRWSKPGV